MYAKFYGLESLAFQLTPDARFFFDSAQHKPAMAHMTYGLHHGEGFIIITGEVGAGKTMLVDRLLSRIDPMSFITAKIVTSQLGGDDLLRMVAAGFGIDHEGLTKASLLTGIHEFVVVQLAAHRRAVLIVDEAQNLSFEALEELRMLSNIVVGRATALQSFLLGQPEFRQKLANRALDQLRQRVTAAYHLGPLTRDDTRSYIEHRLRCVGWQDDPHFEDPSFDIIYRETGGIPRRINNLCSRLLLFGFLEESHAISGSDAERVAADLRAELSMIAVPEAFQPTAVIGKTADAGASTLERLTVLEKTTAKNDRTLRRLIEIMANLFKLDGVNDPR
jgi:general secretion pathway protein A